MKKTKERKRNTAGLLEKNVLTGNYMLLYNIYISYSTVVNRLSVAVHCVKPATAERNGSGLDIRTLDYESPGPNLVLLC